MRFKYLIVFLVFLFLPITSWADTHTAASASYSDVLVAISAASSGDSVVVPAGSATWTSGLTITKGINLIGAGIGKTVITANVPSYCGGQSYAIGYLINYVPSTPANNSPFRLSGFTINQNNMCNGINLRSSSDKQPSVVQSNIRIDHNKFDNSADSTSTYTTMWNYGVYGVVDNNIFLAQVEPIRSGTQNGNNYWWANFANTWGGPTALYFEDNTFTISTAQNNTMLGDGNENAPRMVYRYNNITTNKDMYGAIDVHGNQGQYFYSCYGDDIYGNNISSGSSYIRLTYLRGGKSVVFYNNVTTTSTFKNEVTSGTVNQCPTDYIADQLLHDTYLWRNYKNMSASLAGMAAPDYMVGTCNGLTNIPTEGRDYFYDSSTPGVSCGTLANLPGNCTTGQGYWATNQSCTDLTGMVGAHPATPISGTLYKCTAPNTWTVYYIPYDYPHPLTLSSDPSDATPAPPKNLRIQ